MSRTGKILLMAGLVIAAAAGLFACISPGFRAPEEYPTTSAPSALTVDVVTAQTETWPSKAQADGPITAWQEAIVSPETGGLRIVELLADVGAVVKKGQVLARLADASVQADLRKQEAVVAQALANFDQATSNLRRAQRVESSGALSAQKIEEYRISELTARASLASAQADRDTVKLKLSQTRIVAPDDGVVSSKSAVLGNVVSSGAELYRLIRQGRLEWRPELDARQLDGVQIGQKATVQLPSGDVASGKVRLLAPTLSTTTGRATVFVSLDENASARAGTFAGGVLFLGSRAALTLPQAAVVMRDGRSYVYVIDIGDQVRSRLVVTGRRQGDRIEILSGLDAQSRVVASGGAFLSDGARVSVLTSQNNAKVSTR